MLFDTFSNTRFASTPFALFQLRDAADSHLELLVASRNGLFSNGLYVPRGPPKAAVPKILESCASLYLNVMYPSLSLCVYIYIYIYLHTYYIYIYIYIYIY